MTENTWGNDVIPREVAIANARRVLDAARVRIARDRTLGRLPQQPEFMIRRIEREQLGQPVTDPVVDALLLYCAEGWQHSDGTTHTSLPRLGQATGCSAEDLRDALQRLDTAGEVQLRYGKPETLVPAADLPARAGFVLVVDWPNVNINRPRPM